ncbi:hypothetical protein [Carboxylicivirga sp. M1479]|uniref:rolling circle replication-associated protein n=1 Tax=Carboxylicivirga sp. M1479 TaxID=2594476 RepID=UPI001178CBD8|nr:hypothetical protein [Carboxylicivirga sp. M1479]TRX70531.1 hypothetical protein FNN09_11170 [Carboxylicivirga sp. M1479]
MNLEPTILDNGLIKMPCLSVSPTAITAYTRLMDFNGNFKTWNTGIKPPCENREKGFISKKGQKSLERAIYWFLYSVDPNIVNTGKGKEKITFLTLTLPSKQVHGDKEIKDKCLKQFLTEIRSDYKVTKFIWKAEKQAQGQLHFHILLDKFLPVKEVKQKWNRILNKLGYVYEYHKKMSRLEWSEYRELRLKEVKSKPSDKQKNAIRQAFKNGVACNWMNPNSVDIENLRKVGNIAAYCAKYMSKEHKGVAKEVLKVEGRIWFSSQAVSKMKNLLLVSADDQTYIEEFAQMLKAYQTTSKVYEAEHALMLGVPVDQLRYKGFKTIPYEFDEHCNEIFNRERNIKLFEQQKTISVQTVAPAPVELVSTIEQLTLGL